MGRRGGNIPLALEAQKEARDKEEINRQKMVNGIQKAAKDQFLPTMQEKTKETADLILNLLKDKGEGGLSNIQIMSIIAKKSNLEVALGGATPLFSPQEILEGFNLYLDMINKINEIKKFPPTVESFTAFMGISRTTYDNWLVDPVKKDAMDYINSYLLGVLAVGGLTGETKEISSMFLQKTMGKVEKTQPITIKHEITTDVDEIQNQLNALKQDGIIEAEYTEV